MKMLRVGLCALVLGATVSLGACTTEPALTEPSASAAPSGTSTSASTSPTVAPTTDVSTSAPSETASSQPGSPSATNSDQPVPKVQRDGQQAGPSVSARPTPVDKPVRYPDGVSLQVRSVAFDKETKKGPGSFPGREFAVLSLQVDNKSGQALSMATVVITVLDKDGTPVPPVYSDEADVQDFSGTIKPGATARARYAFAVPKSSRSKVTVVIDFDGRHTSAVFRGKLS